MSRNSKNVRLKMIAKQYTAIHKSGGRGPARTTPKHEKRRENCLWYKYHNNLAIKKAQREEDLSEENAPAVVVTTTDAHVRKFKKNQPEMAGA